MNNLKEKYNISESFYRRYFEQNALNRYAISLSKFIWFRIGKFINPAKKDSFIQTFLEEEIENFYNKNELNIPQVEFNITTKCSLKCKDCCALIPNFNKKEHIDLTFDEFKKQLDKLCTNVNLIRHFIFLGGEPLLNKELPKMLDYACKKSNIELIRVTTNGTIIPNPEVIEVCKNNPNRINFYLSNYSNNPSLLPILKYDEIKKLLHSNNIPFQMVDNWNWLKENGMSGKADNEQETIKKIEGCYRIKCSSVLNGKFDVCSKALAAREFGQIDTQDYINIIQSTNLKQELINFYQKPYPDSCKYCILSQEPVTPALQA